MRRFRNPHFAPESLERKLNPSTGIGLYAMADVYAPSPMTEAMATDSMVVDYQVPQGEMVMETGEIPATTDPDHPRPGDPEPNNPEPTDPPDGSGDPPIDEPSFPGGPGEPA